MSLPASVPTFGGRHLGRSPRWCCCARSQVIVALSLRVPLVADLACAGDVDQLGALRGPATPGASAAVCSRPPFWTSPSRRCAAAPAAAVRLPTV